MRKSSVSPGNVEHGGGNLTSARPQLLLSIIVKTESCQKYLLGLRETYTKLEVSLVLPSLGDSPVSPGILSCAPHDVNPPLRLSCPFCILSGLLSPHLECTLWIASSWDRE